VTDSEFQRVRSLDAVVVEALESITTRVYHRRGPRIQDRFRRYFSMLDHHSRDCAISAFKHLMHAGYDFPPFLVRRWAVSHGWRDGDSQLLDDYAAGVLAGIKYHGADPYGPGAIDRWKASAVGKQPWVDPGRPPQGTPFTHQ
jgi:hypothetical protein